MPVIRSSVRRRSTLVAGAAMLTVVTASGSVSAHDGDAAEGTVHACVATATGALRVLADAAQQCRPSETPLHWTVGNGSSAELAAFRAELATAGTAGLVHWSNLAGVPAGLADGVTYQDLGAVPENFVDGAAVQNGSLSASDLAANSVQSDKIAPEAVQNEDLGRNAVTGDSVRDGSLTAEDLAGSYENGTTGAVTSAKIADGSVEPRDLRPEVASAVQPGPVALSSTADEMAAAVVQGAAGSMVTLSGQVQLSLPETCSPCAGVVSYQLVRNGAPVGPLYRIELSTGRAQDVAGIAFLDTVPSTGAQSYALSLSTDGSPVSASNLVLTAQVLGPQ